MTSGSRRLRTAVIVAALAVPLAAPAAAAVGDCIVPGRVRINDLITAVNIALGDTPIETCRAIDANGDGVAAVDELVLAVLYALGVLPDENAHCGDNVLDADEDCDDGNRDDRDGCDRTCHFEGVGILDQHWSGHRGACDGSRGGVNVGVVGPLAQEFVPRVNAVASVLVDVGSAAGGAGSALRLNIRRATFDGPLLGWASTLVRHPSTSVRQSWVRFDLPVPVAVTPGEVYVLELVGYDDGLLLIVDGGDPRCDEREYLPGDPVSHGQRVEGEDFLFAVFSTTAPGMGAVDQAWYGAQGICGHSTGSPEVGAHTLAQTFTPTRDALAAVAVDLSSVGGLAVTAGTLTLRVRQGSPTGNVLASVQRFLAAPTEGSAWYVFAFSPVLPVTPGTTYALELTDSARRFEWSAETGDASPPGCTEREFAGGQSFVDGEPLANDFRFATFAP